MRHRKDGRQFGRNTSHRRAMFRNLAANLVNHERIVTTDAKAKELRRVTERLITKAKRLGPVAYTPQAELNDEQKAKRLAVFRNIAAFLPRYGVDKEGDSLDLVEKVVTELSKRFEERPGGYTRIIKLGARKGDGASMSIIELVDAAPVVPAEDEAPEEEAAEDEAVEAEAPEEEAPEAEAVEAEGSDGEESGGEKAGGEASDEEGSPEEKS